jgi:hypothetical protein
MEKQIKIIRWLLGFFIAGLFLSGLTAIPVDAELSFLVRFSSPGSNLNHWLSKVLTAYRAVNAAHPFLLYGYDWLAFAHFILAILFVGPYRHPVKNIWVIQFGLIACVLVLPLAFIAGSYRGIPVGWRLIDCSFGLLAAIPLGICYHKAKQLSLHILHSKNQ